MASYGAATAEGGLALCHLSERFNIKGGGGVWPKEGKTKGNSCSRNYLDFASLFQKGGTLCDWGGNRKSFPALAITRQGGLSLPGEKCALKQSAFALVHPQTQSEGAYEQSEGAYEKSSN